MNFICDIRRILVFTVLLAVSCRNPDQNETTNHNQDGSRLDSLREAIREFPDSIDLQQKLVKVLAEEKNWKEARKVQENILNRDTLSGDAWYQMAGLEFAAGDTASGIKMLEKSILLKPNWVDPHLELGFIYADRKDPKALRMGDYILNTSVDPPSQTQARFMKGIYYSNINDKSRAIEQFDSCIIYDYTFLDAYIEKGILLYDQKKFQEAIGVFDKALLVSNTLVEGYYWEGKCYQALNRREEAIDFYKKAVGLDDQFEPAHKALKELGGE